MAVKYPDAASPYGKMETVFCCGGWTINKAMQLVALYTEGKGGAHGIHSNLPNCHNFLSQSLPLKCLENALVKTSKSGLNLCFEIISTQGPTRESPPCLGPQDD